MFYETISIPYSILKYSPHLVPQNIDMDLNNVMKSVWHVKP